MKTQVQERDIAVNAKSKRIMALDLLRGYFLLVILIDHIELFPNGFDFLTGKGRLFVSAAEGFFFMSGLLLGMVYRRRLHLGMKFIFMKIWKRAAQLYVASVALTLLFTVWAVASNHPAIKYGLPEPMSWHWIVKETLLLRFGFGWSDFLMRFAILMLFAPFVFYLVAKRKWWLMVALSFIGWYFRGQNFTLGWQVLYNGGILIGFHWQEILDWFKRLKPQRKRAIELFVIAVTALSFIYSYLSVFVQSPMNTRLSHLPIQFQDFTTDWNHFNDWIWIYAQKWTMGPLRVVLFFFWFSVLFAIVTRYQAPINRKTRGVLELIGRNSLYVYIAHAFIVFIVKFFVPPVTNVLQNFLFTAIALIMLIVATIAYAVLRANPWPSNLDEAKQLLIKGKALISGAA